MSIDGSSWLNLIGCEWIGRGCKDSQSRASPNPSGGRRFAATSVRDNFVFAFLKRKRRQLAHGSHKAKAPLSSTIQQKRSGGSSHGHRQRRRGDHRRRPRRDRQAQRAASAEAEEEREGAVQLLQGRQERGPRRERQGRWRVAARRRGRGDRVGGASAGARGRADVHGGHRAQPWAQQQPAGVDPPRGLRPHLVPLHHLHL